MESFLPVRPSEYGVFDGSRYGTAKRNTYYLAGIKYAGQDGVEKYASPAASPAAGLGYDHELPKQGEWVLPDIDLLFGLVGQLKYPATDDRDADPVNSALKAIGAPAPRNDLSVWSCSRGSEGGVWSAHGSSGYAVCYFRKSMYVTAPLVLLDTAVDGAA